MLSVKKELKNKDLMPPVIFGTSSLGNLYQAIDYEIKRDIVNECIEHSFDKPLFDTAGKYGAGMALETLGKCLSDLSVHPDDVIICNKLGWYQTELLTQEPTFEKGVWVNLKNDAVQKISYDGILECFNQGNRLLGIYSAKMVSVHDPDEYLATASNEIEEKQKYHDILEAYRALADLKKQKAITSIGIGAKNWKVIQRIVNDVELDWVMIANSLTVKSHPEDLMAFIADLKKKNITVINSAVFNGGFLIGSDFYNYQKVDRNSSDGKALYEWRDSFFKLCHKFKVKPAEVCFNFGFNVEGVSSIALNTTKPEKIKENVMMVNKEIPLDFWKAMKEEQLIAIPVIR
ncbi:aldo/keto reductase [Pedobacter foliorum]|uniref:aldo/keto reductase n=1 Tax=Pedobacter foliorum TaxID=2739058 RepID=UPI001563C3D6|nr:aldo/keto reductase [Pedobacter foliorum]NRF37108.1 aldo/keto reductase [Pedobacter foliorum]